MLTIIYYNGKIVYCWLFPNALFPFCEQSPIVIYFIGFFYKFSITIPSDKSPIIVRIWKDSYRLSFCNRL